MYINVDGFNGFRKTNGYSNADGVVISIANVLKNQSTPDSMLGRNDDGSLAKLMTVGGEGIIILDSHPSYPIRGSLGFNADHLVKLIKGEMGIRDVEFELYIGLYFFY